MSRRQHYSDSHSSYTFVGMLGFIALPVFGIVLIAKWVFEIIAALLEYLFDKID